jgi:3-oxoacyl-[acyl-carrier protein] reductase
MTEYIPTYPDLAGKVAVVTGGSGGIGAATCSLLAANSMRVAVNGRDETKIGTVVDEIGSNGGRAIGIAANLTDFAAVERMRRRVEEELGLVDVLAAFAGGGRMGTPEDVALATLFLASESSSWITGVTMGVAVGQIMV